MENHDEMNESMAEGEHHLHGLDEGPKTAIVEGQGRDAQPMSYIEVDGLAIIEGDIIIGTADQLATADGVVNLDSFISADGIDDDLQAGVVIDGERYRWTNGVVPYEIRPGFNATDRQEIIDAIAHWHQHTNLRFVRRTSQANYVYFRTGTGCSSYVGMRGGAQPITLTSGCSKGNVIHEIGHAVGLWHEHTREDRDRFVRINFANIRPEAVGNFTKQISNGIDVGAYDYGSVMHYPRRAFSRNGQDTIVPLRAGVSIGQRSGLSRGDIATVRWMYPNLEPSRSWQGVQFRGSVAAGATRTWFTHSWPSYWYVNWSLMPTAPVQDSGRQLGLEVAVTRQEDRKAKYYLTVRNHSNAAVQFDARYAVLGWSRASRDEVEGDAAVLDLIDGGAPEDNPAGDTGNGSATESANGNGAAHSEHANGQLVDAGAGPAD